MTARRRAGCKIGYVSPDFRTHSVAYFLDAAARRRMTGAAVELFCYADVTRPDAVTAHLQSLADHWLSTVGMPDDALAERIRADGIDILVDLAGHTAQQPARRVRPQAGAGAGDVARLFQHHRPARHRLPHRPMP